MRLLLKLKALLTHLHRRLRVEIDWRGDRSLCVCTVLEHDGHLGEIADGISHTSLWWGSESIWWHSVCSLHVKAPPLYHTQGGLAMLKTITGSKWSIWYREEYLNLFRIKTSAKWPLYHFTSETTRCLSLHIRICANICHFSFHRLWTYPFLSNLQGLASTTAK